MNNSYDKNRLEHGSNNSILKILSYTVQKPKKHLQFMGIFEEQREWNTSNLEKLEAIDK